MVDFDMHIHSICSDGEYQVNKIIDLLIENNFKYFSITDHDNIDSIEYVNNIDLKGLNYITGVEVTSLLDNQYKMHILGYGFDFNNQKLKEMLEDLKIRKRKRFVEVNNLLKTKCNISLPQADIDDILANKTMPAKPHIASLLVKYGYAKSVPEAFDQYLDNINVSIRYNEDALKVIQTIHNAHGIAILAHPKEYEKKYNIDFHIIMDRLLELGIDGIEIYNSLHLYDDCLRYTDYAKKHNLITSGGSDYHGIHVKPDVKLGMLYKDKEEIKGKISIIKSKD